MWSIGHMMFTPAHLVSCLFPQQASHTTSYIFFRGNPVPLSLLRILPTLVFSERHSSLPLSRTLLFFLSFSCGVPSPSAQLMHLLFPLLLMQETKGTIVRTTAAQRSIQAALVFQNNLKKHKLWVTPGFYIPRLMIAPLSPV